MERISNELKNFQGSAEEKILQTSLERYNILKKICINLVIQSCNVHKPVPFTDADVVLLPFCEQREKVYEDYPSKKETNQRIIRFEKLLNTELIQKLTAGVGAAPDECKPAVLCLLKFLRG
jgi:hypothetical protein